MILVSGCTNIFPANPSPTPSPSPIGPSPDLQPESGVLNAIFINNTIPGIMVPGQSYAVSIILQNTGDVKFSKVSNITMVALNDGVNDALLFNNTTAFSFAPGIVVSKNNTYTWKLSMVAPRWTGNYMIMYQMVDGNNTSFGDTLVKNITVGTPGADGGKR